MTDRYFDWDSGSDAADGLAPATAKKTFTIVGASDGDNFYFKRGTTQIVTTQFQGIKSGISNTQRSAYGVYGEAQVDWAGFRAGHEYGDMILNLARRKYCNFTDLRFDATGVSNALYCGAQSTFATTDMSFVRAHVYNANSSGISVAQEATATAQPARYEFDDCQFYNNKGHGLAFIGMRGAIVRNSKFFGNGYDISTGGHGLTARFARTNPTGGWSSVGSGVYRRALAASETTVYYVYDSAAATEKRMVENTSTPTTPSSGQWGQDGGYLYVHVGGSDPASNVYYAWGICDYIQVIDSEAYNTYWDRDAPGVEGHGFAFDDWTQDSLLLRCKSYGNEGLGFSINRGDRNRIISSIAYNNGRGGVEIYGSARNNTVDNSTLVLNGTIQPLDSEVRIQGTSANYNKVRNTVIVTNRPYGIDWSNNPPTEAEAINCAISGHTSATINNGSESNTITSDPQLDANYRPLPTSPCIAAGKSVDLPILAYDGSPFRNPPSIGAHEYRQATNRAQDLTRAQR